MEDNLNACKNIQEALTFKATLGYMLRKLPNK